MKLCSHLGHEIFDVENPVNGEAFFDAYVWVMLHKMSDLIQVVESMSGRSAESSGLLTPMTVSMGRAAAEFPEGAYAKWQRYFQRLAAEMENFFRDVDLWLTLVAPIEPPEIGMFCPDHLFDDKWYAITQYMSYTPVANAVGAPAMPAPLYWSPRSGLPIGTHFMAKPGNDRMLYELAFELETERPWAHRWAPYSAKYRLV